MRKQAAGILEDALVDLSNLNDYQRMVCLDSLYNINAEMGNLDGAIEAVERILKIKTLPGSEADKWNDRLQSLRTHGLRAFLQRQIDAQIKIMSNRGRSAGERRESMRRLHMLLSDPNFMQDERMMPIIDKAWRACVRTLSPPTPPELSIDMLQFFRRNLRDPKILRIVVHFFYPQGIEKGITENVRVEAVRTAAGIAGMAAVPSLLHSLNDDSLAVTRAVDVALNNILDRRSAIQPGAGPVTKDEQRILRRAWVQWTHSASGNVRLTEAIQALHEATAKDQGFNRKQQHNPLADHVIRVVLLDNDVKWEAWEAGYLFLRDFLGRDFLPPDLRGKVVTPALRKTLRDEIEKWWRGAATTQEEAENQTGKPREPAGDDEG